MLHLLAGTDALPTASIERGDPASFAGPPLHPLKPAASLSARAHAIASIALVCAQVQYRHVPAPVRTAGDGLCIYYSYVVCKQKPGAYMYISASKFSAKQMQDRMMEEV